MGKKIDFESTIGKRFGTLVVTGVIREKKKNTKVIYICDCGHVQTKSSPQLKEYAATCKICFKYPIHNKTHGMTGSPIYSIWKTMRQRCNNPNNIDYKHYGERGIKICARWNDFKKFFEDMGHRPEGKSLDRINNNGPYSKKNCKWSTQEEQVRNSRKFID